VIRTTCVGALIALACSRASAGNTEMSTTELRDLATVVAAAVALAVFLINSFFQIRNKRIENLSRFIEAHKRLFTDDGYILKNVTAFNAGTIARDQVDGEMEKRFHNMLLEVERLAILGNNKAVPRHTQVYMFGWYARLIHTKLISAAERENMFWELARGYLEALTVDTEKYERLSPQERKRFWQ